MREFRDFMFRGDAFDVAAGIIIGTAFGRFITSIVEDLVMPLFAVISPRIDWREWAVHVGASTIRIGHIVGALVDFLIVSLVLFLVVTRVIRRLR